MIPVSALRFFQRHTIAASCSFILLTAVIALLATRGSLGDWVHKDQPWRSAVIGALGITFVIFFPFAAIFDLTTRKRRQPVWVAPLSLALGFTIFWMVIDPGSGRFMLSFFLQYFLFGSYLALAFCSYWIPLRFIAARMGPSLGAKGS